MMIEKLNQALKELDALEAIIWSNECGKEHNLEIQFGCPDGGHYEDITLSMKFDGASVAHLPNYCRGIFEVIICDTISHKTYVPYTSYEEFENCLSFKINDEISRFYLQYQYFSWEMTGNSGFLLNKHELKPTNFYDNQ